MKKSLAISLALLSTATFATDICEFDSFRAENAHLCVEKEGFFGKYYEGSELFVRMAGGEKAYKKKFDITGASEGKKRGNQMVQNFEELSSSLSKGLIAKSPFSSYRATELVANYSTERVQADITRLTEEKNKGNNLQSYLAQESIRKSDPLIEQYASQMLDEKGAPSANCIQDTEGCGKALTTFMQNSQEYIKGQEQQVQSNGRAIAEAKAGLEEKAKELEEVYNEKFKPGALKKLRATSPEEFASDDSINSICTKAAEKGLQSTINVCNDLTGDISTVKKAKEKIASLLEDAEKAEDLNEFLGMKIDLEGMSLEQKRIALASLQPEIQKRLKGTVLGSMMDQMREDMCSVAQNPKAMCTGSIANLQSFIDDTSDAISKEESLQRFQQRSISSSVSQEN